MGCELSVAPMAAEGSKLDNQDCDVSDMITKTNADCPTINIVDVTAAHASEQCAHATAVNYR
jgi:hypothetical protein